MSKATVLFFAADPVSASSSGELRLQLDEDIRRIREKVRGAEHRDSLFFDLRPAARSDDLIQALNETSPQVVHFSGHGSSEGLVLVGPDRSRQVVSASALERLFQVFRRDIQVVVLNSCFSLPQAQAIATVVGCAIGTRKEISDEAAITFGASFYRALAFGHSVRTAFDQACAAVYLDHPGEEGTPQIVAGPGVDPTRIFVVRHDNPGMTGAADSSAPAQDRSPGIAPPNATGRASFDHHPAQPRDHGWTEEGVRPLPFPAKRRSRRWVSGVVVVVAALLTTYTLRDPIGGILNPGVVLDPPSDSTQLSNGTMPPLGRRKTRLLLSLIVTVIHSSQRRA